MRADVAILAGQGIFLSEEEAHRRFVGKTFQGMLDELSIERGVAFPAGLSSVKDALVEDLYRRDLRIVPGVSECLEQLAATGMSFSVASNSPGRRVALALQLTGISRYFAAVTTKDDVKEGKPAPDVFLRAAEISGRASRECVAVEDSVTGVSSSVAAGLRTIGFFGVHPDLHGQGERLKEAGAVTLIAHMRDLPAALRNLS
jgi:HAD superfamily hydrolase (TIGR01509 family)